MSETLEHDDPTLTPPNLRPNMGLHFADFPCMLQCVAYEEAAKIVDVSSLGRLNDLLT